MKFASTASRSFIAWVLGRSFGAVFAAVLALVFTAPYFPALVESFGRRTSTVEATVQVTPGVTQVVVESEDTRVLGERALQKVSLAAAPEAQKRWEIEISADGSRNPQSSSAELWIFGITTPEGAFPLKRAKRSPKKGWQLVKDPRAQGGRLAVSTAPGAKSFKAVVTGSELSIFLLHHSFSGKIRLRVNDDIRELDLFEPHDGKIVRIDFGRRSAGIPGEPEEWSPRTISFAVPEPFTGRRSLKVEPTAEGKAEFKNGSIAGQPLQVQEGALEREKGVLSPALLRTVPLVLLLYLGAFLILLLIPFIRSPRTEGKDEAAVPLSAQCAAFGLFAAFSAGTTALLIGIQPLKFALLPLVILSGIIAFSAEIIPRSRWWCLLLLCTLLQLKLPLLGFTGAAELQLCFAVALLVLILERLTAAHLRRETIAPFLASVLIIALCSLTHLSMLSPYSTVCVLAIWPEQYLTVLDGMILNGDYPHFVDLFGSYTSSAHLPGMSVVLRRFFYEYVWSVLTPQGPSWAVAFAMNVMLWVLSSSAMILTAHQLFRSRTSCWFAALATGGLILFTTYVSQPMLYLAAYGWAFILVGAAVRILPESRSNQEDRFSSFFLSLVCGAIATYDMIPVVVPLFFLMLWARSWKMAGAIVTAQIVIPLIWAQGVLMPLAGTLGPESNRGFISLSIEKWRTALFSGDFATMSLFVLRGVRNLCFASYGVGVLVLLWFLGTEARRFRWRGDGASGAGALLVLGVISLLINLAIAVAVAPELATWSPGANLPRLSAYYYPLLILAACSLLKLQPLRIGVGWGVFVALISFMDTLGIYQPIMILQYGWWFGVY